jgi:hypothetical protein
MPIDPIEADRVVDFRVALVVAAMFCVQAILLRRFLSSVGRKLGMNIPKWLLITCQILVFVMAVNVLLFALVKLR